ncbi:MAG: O-antigen ligase family protein [Gallionellaceae bacterium]
MRRIIEVLAFILVVLSSGAFIQLIKDGGARDAGSDNMMKYSGPLNALPLVWVTAVIFLLYIFFLQKKRRKIDFSWPMVALISFCFASVAWSDIPVAALRSSVLIAAAYLLINVQVVYCGWQDTMRFLSVTFYIILICSVLAVFIIPHYGMATDLKEPRIWQGVFDHKNGLGNFSSICSLLFMWNFQQQKSKMALTGVLLSIVIVIGSQSSTSLATIVLLIFLFTLLSFKFTEKIIYKFRYAIILLLIVLSLFMIYVALRFQEFSILEKDSSFTGRNMIWIYILKKMASSPWVGYGLDQLSVLTNNNSGEFFNNVGFVVATAHNGFLETVFALGYIGLVLTAWVIMNQLTEKKGAAGFSLLFGYLVSFIMINTFESRMISFNVHFIGLMYVMAIAGAMAPPGKSTVCDINFKK